MIQPSSIRSPQSNSSSKSNFDRLVQRIVLIAILCLLLGLILYRFVEGSKSYSLTLAAGDARAESYQLSQAIATVVERNQPRIHIHVIATGGTVENIGLLESGRATLSTAQADMPSGQQGRAIAILYRDLFLLVVKKNSAIHSFADLKDRQLGLAPTSGQFHSFMEVATHYGLTAQDFHLAGTNPQQISEAFRQNRIEALFSARPPGSEAIADFVQHYQGQLLAIDQAEAMRLKYPAFEPAIVPQGTYQGDPPIPIQDLKTVAVRHLLLASQQVNPWVVRQITQIINENRQQLAEAIAPEFSDIRPLVTQISRPNLEDGTSVPLHEGAIAYYNRNQPNFIEEHSNLISLVVSIITLAGSGFVALRVKIQQNQKDKTDEYIRAALQCLSLVSNNPTGGMQPAQVQQQQQRLETIFEQAVDSLTRTEISQESFRTFNEVYKDVREALERKYFTLTPKDHE
jgi:uncharacterized protein